jgi:hypothetical protein
MAKTPRPRSPRAVPKLDHGKADDAIDAFWSWWKKARGKVERALVAQELGPLEGQITAKVRAIEPGLKWELGPGDAGKHAFALVWDGDLLRRRLAERWRLRAPAKDKAWEYCAARPAGKGWERLVMHLGKHRIDFGQFVCTFEVDATRERVDAEIFHPALAKTNENVRGTASFVMLDRAFGEDGVERWLGGIELLKKRPRGAKPVTDLVKAVAKLARKAKGQVFALYQGTHDGRPVFLMKNEALKPIEHLACDAQLEIALHIEDANDAGLPTKKESLALDKVEDALLTALGDDVAYFGRQTHAGKRTLYFFAAQGGKAAKAVTTWAKKQKRVVSVTWTPDPMWEGLERWS